MRSGPARLRFRFAVLALLLAAAGCKHPTATTPATPAAPETPAASTPPPPQPTVTLQAMPNFVQRGESSTLRWSSTNATTLSLTPTVGSVAPEGSTSVTPTDSTTYTITAGGPGGSAMSSVRVTVSASPVPGGAEVSSNGTLEQLFAREVQDAYFDLDKADIRTDARDALSKTAQFLRSYPNIKVQIEGHCDERGSTEYNLALGDRRAAAAKSFLVSLGIPADRMDTISYGKERPFCMDHNENCWQQNRRAHFVMAK